MLNTIPLYGLAAIFILSAVGFGAVQLHKDDFKKYHMMTSFYILQWGFVFLVLLCAVALVWGYAI